MVNNLDTSAGFYSGVPADGKTANLVEGLTKFRIGILLQFLSSGIGLFAAICMLTVVLIPVIVFIYLGVFIISLIAYIQIFVSTGFFKKYDPERLALGRTGMLMEIISIGTIAISTIIAITTIEVSAFSDIFINDYAGIVELLRNLVFIVPIFIVGIVLAFVGYILFLIFVMRLGEISESSGNLKTGGTLLIVGLILSMIPYVGIVGSALIFVAWVLIYTGVGGTLKALQYKNSNAKKESSKKQPKNIQHDEKYNWAKKRVDALKGFYAHLISYVAVNAMLFAINAVTSWGTWWFFWVTVFWGFGLMWNAIAVFLFEGAVGKNWEEKKIKEYMEKEK